MTVASAMKTNAAARRRQKAEALESERERQGDIAREFLNRLGVRCPACGSVSLADPHCGNSRHFPKAFPLADAVAALEAARERKVRGR